MGKKESKKNDKPAEVSTVQDTEPKKRYEIVDRKLVLAELERLKKSTEGNERERVDRLSFYYAHEAQQGKIKLADCQPDDASDPTGCWFRSDATLDACPFCGKGGPVVPMPTVPLADRDIELNVKAAESKLVKPAGEKSDIVKVKPKDIKAKKKERNEVVEAKPIATELVTAEPKSEAIVTTPESIDLPSENVGGTAADLDRICEEISFDLNEYAKNQAVMMWRVGKKFAQIRDRKLWSTVRREDGGYGYGNFGSFVAQRFADFEFTPDHAMLLIRIASEFSEEEAIFLGSAKAKAILDARNARNLPPITEAQKNELTSVARDLSLSELRAKIKGIQLQLTTGTNPTAVRPSDADDRDDDLDADDEDESDDEDDLDDENEPNSVRTKSTKSAPPKMTSLSFEAREFSLPLVQKGSQIKAAKKIQDEPHGSLQVPGGAKIHFVIRIGDEGQLFLDGRIETPY